MGDRGYSAKLSLHQSNTFHSNKLLKSR